MAIVEWQKVVRRFLPFVAVVGLLPCSVSGQIKLSPGRVPIGDNELNSPIAEPQVTIDEHSSNAVMRPTPLWVQQTSDPLIKLVYQTREAQRRRLLSTSEHTPWQIMHGMLALREEFLIRHNGQPISCLEWIKSGPTFENENWFEKTQIRVLTSNGANNSYEMMTVGRGHPYNKPYAFEGHINQFVAIMSMSGVPLETQFQTPQGPVSMRDMLTYAKMTVNEKEEVTWTLSALSRYLPSDAEWTNAQGEKWSIERLVAIETSKSLQGAPCGGTHGLFALAHARNVYLRTGKPLVGVWLAAEQKIRRYIQTARYQQNPNGTLSSNYFRGREYKQDFDKRMGSSGHVLEFLMMALPSQELNSPWVRRAIEATSNDLMANRKAFVSCSPLFHATSALSIYIDRVAAVTPQMAQGVPKTHTISSSKELKTVDASLSVPVVENSEAVKTPVMESSGVDENGAPKALTGPVTTVPDRPEKSDAQPAPALPTPLLPTPTVPTPTVPTPTVPTPTVPTPMVPTPTDPTPTDPTPTDPTPTDPTPTDPTPTDPTPTDPTPTVPTPTVPTPTVPTPTVPTPTVPTPTVPTPTVPTPTVPTPTVPTPTVPTPTVPTPTVPTPTVPTPTVPTPTVPTPDVPTPTDPTESETNPSTPPADQKAMPSQAGESGSTSAAAGLAIPLQQVSSIAPEALSSGTSENAAAQTPAQKSESEGDKLRFFGPKAVAEPGTMIGNAVESQNAVDPKSQFAVTKSPTLNAVNDAVDLPLSPVPQVPRPDELMSAAVETVMLPTPISIPGMIDITAADPEPPPAGSETMLQPSASTPLRSVSDPRVHPIDSSEPSENHSQEKKGSGWKATPSERRKVIVIKEKISEV